MKGFEPYRILNVRLDCTPDWKASVPDEGRCYLVFWWQQIPLGHLYAAREELSDPDRLEALFAQAVAPALAHYGLQGLQPTQWNEILRWTLMASPSVPPETQSGVQPVSIIICTRNRPGLLLPCLQSLQSLCAREIIVVDNSPQDGRTLEVVRQFPSVTYVPEPRKGLDVARNTGIRKATAPVVAFVDDDVTIHPSWLEQLLLSFQNEEVVAMTGLVQPAALDTEAQWIFERFWGFNRGYMDRFYSDTFLKKHLAGGPPVWEIGAGANMAFRRKIFEQVGYFDERLDAGAAGCNGDSEIWFRILAAGGTIHYNPRAVVWHRHRAEMRELMRQIRAYMRGFTVACLIQQQQLPEAGYRTHLLRVLPKFYLKQAYRGFPFYRGTFATLWSEMRGMASGWSFYFSCRKKPAFKKETSCLP